MTGAGPIERTPWDAAALGCDTFELADAGAAAMARVRAPGHYTVKVDPLSDKRSLHDNGFYYCDTLLEVSTRGRESVRFAVQVAEEPARG